MSSSVSTTVGYDAHFISDTPEYLQCVVCHYVLRDPLIIIECGHKSCTPCFQRLQKNATQMGGGFCCPVDQQVVDVNKVVEDVGLKRAIANLQVKCWNSECTWEGVLSELHQHEDQCEYKEEDPTANDVASVRDLQELQLRVTKCERMLQGKDEEIESLKHRCSKMESDMMFLTIELDEVKGNEPIHVRSDSLNSNSSKAERVNKLPSVSGSTALSRNPSMLSVVSTDGSQTPKMIPRQQTGRLFLERYRGDVNSVTINSDNTVTFPYWSTIASPTALVSQGQKVYFEVTFKGKQNEKEGVGCYVGWGTSDFRPSLEHHNSCLGWCENSWSFDGQRQKIWHRNKNTAWGKQFKAKGDRVLGVAADMCAGRLWYGLNGLWANPMGVAFRDVSTDADIFPAITAMNLRLFVNFGQASFEHGPPDSSFRKLIDVIPQ